MVLFGLFSGAAVPLAQYFGVKDFKSIRKIVGMDIAIGLVLGMLTVSGVLLFAPHIIGLFADEAEVIRMGSSYIRIVAVTYLTVGISFAVTFNSRPIQILKIPTIINVCSILINTALNYVLIYGHFGFSAMGVEGAALATAIARIVEMTALLIYLWLDKEHPFHGRVRDFLGFSRSLFNSVMRTAMPVVFSEGGWALGMSLTFAAYGRISAQALAVIQVCQVLCNLCQCASFGMGNACAALVGETLGRQEIDLARDNAKKYMKVQWTLNFLMCLMILLLRAPVAAFYQFDPDAFHGCVCGNANTADGGLFCTERTAACRRRYFLLYDSRAFVQPRFGSSFGVFCGFSAALAVASMHFGGFWRKCDQGSAGIPPLSQR